MKKVDFIPKEKRDWFVGDTLGQCFDFADYELKKMSPSKRKKSKLKPRKACKCPLVGWLECGEDLSHYATQSYDGKIFVAIYAGENTKYQHDDKPKVSITENPYLIYGLGNDDVSLSLRFKTLKEMKECLSKLKNFEDIDKHPNRLWNN